MFYLRNLRLMCRTCSCFPGHAADELDFFDHVRRAVVARDFVEPDGRFAFDVRMLPRIPRQVCLRLTLHESPVDHANVVYLADRHRAEKETAVSTRHVLRADQRTVVAREPVDPFLKLRWRVVVVKCDHVRQIDLETIHRGHLFRRGPIAFPDAGSQRLLGLRFTRPCERLRQERGDELEFVLRFEFVITAEIFIVRLVPDVPRENALIASERADNAFHVRFEMRILRRVLERRAVRTLYPAGVVYARARLALFSELRIRIPHGVEEHEHRSDLVFRGDGEKLIQATLEAFRVLLPEQVVKKDAHRVHAETFRPTELEIDSLRIERVRLPHLELIDRARRIVIPPDEPWLFGVPVARLLI